MCSLYQRRERSFFCSQWRGAPDSVLLSQFCCVQTTFKGFLRLIGIFDNEALVSRLNLPDFTAEAARETLHHKRIWQMPGGLKRAQKFLIAQHLAILTHFFAC